MTKKHTSRSKQPPRLAGPRRLRVEVSGVVQGVGFRPFVFRLATDLGLAGCVSNTPRGVFIEVEGPPEKLDEFLVRIPREKPPICAIYNIAHVILDPAGYTVFNIVESETPKDGGAVGAGRTDEDESRAALITVPVLPDIATCPDCLRELGDNSDRRYRYPFINCTNCGPRFSIIEALPYDRPNTTMKRFVMCDRCAAEYNDPADRRFHAQPNACPVCGPRLELWDKTGKTLLEKNDALLAAVAAVRSGEIVAVKGLGGFQLVVDGRNDDAVRRLRKRKRRDEKPFALMAPSIDAVRALCDVSDVEAHLLQSPEAPIVLLCRKNPREAQEAQGTREAREAQGAPQEPVAPSVAPGNPYLGVMLPYTPLHHLLTAELGFPVVATSGNLAEEPIVTDERDAVERLGGIADVFLVHDRPIERHVDDSVARVVAGRAMILRRARGYSPLPLPAPGQDRPAALALGGHLKNAVAIAHAGQLICSQHIGDMSTTAALDAFGRTAADFRRLYRFEPEVVVCDAHPDYVTTKQATVIAGAIQPPPRIIKIQHHYAHVAACMAENELDGPVLGVSWDGTGYGADGTVWGGEFLRVDAGSFERVGHLRTFRLPGGDEAVREPRRAAAGVLFELLGDDAFASGDLETVRAFAQEERGVIAAMLSRGINAPVTSSAGRLFDAVASIAGVRQHNHYEGQAAMELEFAIHGIHGPDPREPEPASFDAERYRLEAILQKRGPVVVDWGDMVRAIIADVGNGVGAGRVSTKFHDALAEAIVTVARIVGEERVLLTGGCFQNKYLTEKAVVLLETAGFKPYWHQRIPPNDGGIALGQLAAATTPKDKQ